MKSLALAMVGVAFSFAACSGGDDTGGSLSDAGDAKSSQKSGFSDGGGGDDGGGGSTGPGIDSGAGSSSPTNDQICETFGERGPPCCSGVANCSSDPKAWTGWCQIYESSCSTLPSCFSATDCATLVACAQPGQTCN